MINQQKKLWAINA